MPTFLKQPCDEGVVGAGQPVAPCAPGSELWVLAATILGSSMVFIDGTVVNVALPVLQVDLHATVAQVQWIVEAYALFLAALILLGGSLGDHFGRRRTFGLGVAVFAAASAWCGVAPDANILIVARAVQGIGGALLTPGSLAIIGATFGADRRGRAIGTWSGATAITTAIGPVLGGWLVEHASWRWVFFLNVPLAAAVLGIAAWHVPESRDEAAARLDGWGALLATFGLGGLTFGLIESGTRGLGDPTVLGALGLGVAALATFLLVEARSRAPMMPLGLFRSRTFGGANLVTFLLYGGLAGALFFVPFNLIQVQGYSPTAAGAALLPFVLIMSGLSRWSGGLVDKYGARLPLVVGPAIAAAAAVLYAMTGIGGSYWTTFFPAVAVQGVGMAITVAPLTTVVMGAVDVRHAGLASGINNAVSRTAGLLAVALMGMVVLTAFNRALDVRLEMLALPPEAVQSLHAQRTRLAAAEIPSGLDPMTTAALRRAIDESFLDGFRLAMYVGTGMALAGALSASALIEGRGATAGARKAKPHPYTATGGD
jgi:EmrB/QacA subfamily drug resistance transporter